MLLDAFKTELSKLSSKVIEELFDKTQQFYDYYLNPYYLKISDEQCRDQTQTFIHSFGDLSLLIQQISCEEKSNEVKALRAQQDALRAYQQQSNSQNSKQEEDQKSEQPYTSMISSVSSLRLSHN